MWMMKIAVRMACLLHVWIPPSLNASRMHLDAAKCKGLCLDAGAQARLTLWGTCTPMAIDLGEWWKDGAPEHHCWRGCSKILEKGWSKSWLYKARSHKSEQGINWPLNMSLVIWRKGLCLCLGMKIKKGSWEMKRCWEKMLESVSRARADVLQWETSIAQSGLFTAKEVERWLVYRLGTPLQRGSAGWKGLGNLLNKFGTTTRVWKSEPDEFKCKIVHNVFSWECLSCWNQPAGGVAVSCCLPHLVSVLWVRCCSFPFTDDANTRSCAQSWGTWGSATPCDYPVFVADEMTA